MPYDYKSARARIQELRNFWLTAKASGAEDIDLMWIEAQIDELEREIADAHKKAAVASSGSEKIIYMPIIA